MATTPTQTLVTAVIVSAGFSGLLAIYKMRELGIDVQGLEADADIGGTWYWNQYPGARCDIESTEYSYQFSEALQQSWEWSEQRATQLELLRYANHVANEFNLRAHITFNTRVISAQFDETTHR